MSPPSPGQRADFLVRKLEQFIRDGKTEKGGMSFATWQQLAREEISSAFAEIEKERLTAKEDRVVKRMLDIAASAVVTIGFWGVIMAVLGNFGMVPATILTLAGFALLVIAGEWSLRKAASRYRDEQRLHRFYRIEDFDKKIKKFENEMKKRHERAKEESRKIGERR